MSIQMPDFQQLTAVIEGSDFRFNVNAASGFKMFKKLLKQQESFQMLEAFASTKSGCSTIEGRIQYLLELEIDPKYEHPYDTAIATYLFALQRAEYSSIRDLANEIFSLDCFWWARHIAGISLLPPRGDSE